MKDENAMNQIDLIIFDLGHVLVDFDFKKVVRGLHRHSSKSELEIRRYFSTTVLWDRFERGLVNPPEFFKSLQKDLKLKGLTFEKFIPMWNDIFREKHDTVEVLRKLRGRYRLAMLSNVNPMHWDHVNLQHAFMRWFDYPVASYAVGYRKPEPEIFLHVLRQAGVPPSRALFIDDIPSHIRAAQSVGIRSHQFHDAKKLLLDLDGVLE
jgi:HAD superfamily hydrolase (TIGR01549 family)